MNELRGKYVNVVLGVEAGKDMEFLQHPVQIVAHFNGRIMESDSVSPESGPDFNTELVWETEKKVIRKVRSTNLPLRVECFSVDLHGQKECVGFTLLSLRSAHVISSNNTSEIPTKWYKLIGVPQAYKKSHPELYMSLTLRDHCLSSVIPPALPEFPHPSLEHYANGNKTVIPIRFIDGGYIRIGHENDKTGTYDLKIIIIATSNLHLLMSKDVVFASTKNRFYVTFSMFGITINTKPFYNDPNELIALRDNIVIKLVASFDILKLFFGQFDEVLVTFSHGENKLGSTKIHLDKLLADVGEAEFKEARKAWLGSLCISVSFFTAPLVVAICRRKSTRLAAVLGGLTLALACLFTSFAMQFHQALLSYGIVLGAGAGIVRETSGLVLGHYFKRRREFVEMVCQTGTGVGMALFSVLYKEAVGKLGWRLGLQAVTGLLSLGFFLPIVYRSANLYHPQRRAIMHLKNQRKKVKEKKTHTKTKKPPMFDFTPLKNKSLKVLLAASATGALGIYAPIIYLAYQGYKEGLEDSALVLLQTFLGFASALGCVGFGLVTVRPSSQCLISRQYLCQASMVGIGVSLLALSAVQGYHGYVLFVWMYGVCLGGYSYSLKMFTLERIRGRHFTKAWSFVQGAKSIPVLIGIPITGYINQSYPKCGYYFSFASTMIGASLMFLVGSKSEPNLITTNTNNCNYNVANLNECICPTIAAYNVFAPYNVYRPTSGHYERIFTNYDPFVRNSSQRHSVKHKTDLPARYLPKSLSYAANIECSSHPGDFNRYNYVNHVRSGNNLRPSKSFPEGLARWDHYGSYRRPIVRNVQVIEQITTSV